jgi:hypothetical protein
MLIQRSVRVTAERMPPAKKDPQVLVRVPESLLSRASALAETAGRFGGVTPSRAETLRVCLARGLDAMAADLARFAP